MSPGRHERWKWPPKPACQSADWPVSSMNRPEIISRKNRLSKKVARSGAAPWLVLLRIEKNPVFIFFFISNNGFPEIYISDFFLQRDGSFSLSIDFLSYSFRNRIGNDSRLGTRLANAGPDRSPVRSTQPWTRRLGSATCVGILSQGT